MDAAVGPLGRKQKKNDTQGVQAATRTVLIAVFTLSPLISTIPTRAAALTTTIRLNAVVLPQTCPGVLNQPSQIVVTNADLQRGFLQVDGAVLLEIIDNSSQGCVLSIEAMEMPFRKATVSFLGKDVALGPNGGLITFPISGTSFVALDFHFTLSPDTKAGTYPWPFVLSASSLQTAPR